MILHMMMGTHTANREAVFQNEIIQTLKNEPFGKPIILLVPEQMTFQQEQAILAQEVKGSIRAQVLSFSRLSLRVLEETGGATKALISSTGIQMMLRKIIEEKKTDWRIFGKSVEQKGFIEQLEMMIAEFKRYKVTPDSLREIMEHELNESLTDKMDDLYYIYMHLTEALSQVYVDSEDRLRLLEEKISESDFLAGAQIYIHGFHRFTPQEQGVISELMSYAGDITVSLILSEDRINSTDAVDIFSQTRETHDLLIKLAEQKNRLIRKTFMDKDPEVKPHVLHLDQAFDQRPARHYENQAPIKLAYGVHPRAEIEGVAQEILSQVRDDGYRFKDIALLVRDGGLYHDLIETIFEDYQIPVFIDEKKPMLNHPFIELIRSVFDVVLTDWRYDSVFRLLKTGLFPAGESSHRMDSDGIDTLENYVLEYGIRGRHQWLGDKSWVYERFKGFEDTVKTDEERLIEEQLNTYREHIKRYLGTLDEQMQMETSIREKMLALFTFIETIQVSDQLDEWQETLEREGKTKLSRDQEQVWQKVMHLFDEIVEIMGEEFISTATLKDIIETGLDALTYQHVPPTLDHVVVGSIDRSRLAHVKSSFLIGVNEGSWPKKPTIDTVLTEDERHLLERSGLPLADSETQQLIDDWFYIYLAVTQAKERMWISYTLSDTEGKAKAPANLIKRIQQIFKSLEPEIMLQDPEEMLDPKRFITNKNKTLSALIAQLSKYNRNYPIDEIWWYVLDWFTQHESKGKLQQVLSSLYYDNKPVSLKTETARALYPQVFKTSISRMEQYNACSYKHFAQYSLNLQERSQYKLDAPDIGTLFHEALKDITEKINLDNRTFDSLRAEDADYYAKQAVDKLSRVLQHQILHSSNRYQYISSKLERVVSRATYILSEQARRTDFAPVGLEVGFGLANSQLAPKRIQLENDYELVLRGRIDRVDRADIDHQTYLRIIDYKSSAKMLDLNDVYYGLSLQMLAYLDVLLENASAWLNKDAEPAGLLYFHVHDAIFSGQEDLTDEKLEEELFKAYKMKGLLTNNPAILQRMDTLLDTGISPVVPIEIKKNGDLGYRSKVVEPEVFHDLSQYVLKLIQDAGVKITSGDIQLNPYQKKEMTACTYCPFKSVCQFDPSLDSNCFDKMRDLSEDQVLEAVKEGGHPHAELDR